MTYGPTTAYVSVMVSALAPVGGVRRITESAMSRELRIAVYVTSASAKARVVGWGGENIHAIQHLAREHHRRIDPGVKVNIDVILGGVDATGEKNEP